MSNRYFWHEEHGWCAADQSEWEESGPLALQAAIEGSGITVGAYLPGHASRTWGGGQAVNCPQIYYWPGEPDGAQSATASSTAFSLVPGNKPNSYTYREIARLPRAVNGKGLCRHGDYILVGLVCNFHEGGQLGYGPVYRLHEPSGVCQEYNQLPSLAATEAVVAIVSTGDVVRYAVETLSEHAPFDPANREYWHHMDDGGLTGAIQHRQNWYLGAGASGPWPAVCPACGREAWGAGDQFEPGLLREYTPGVGWQEAVIGGYPSSLVHNCAGDYWLATCGLWGPKAHGYVYQRGLWQWTPGNEARRLGDLPGYVHDDQPGVHVIETRAEGAEDSPYCWLGQAREFIFSDGRQGLVVMMSEAFTPRWAALDDPFRWTDIQFRNQDEAGNWLNIDLDELPGKKGALATHPTTGRPILILGGPDQDYTMAAYELWEEEQHPYLIGYEVWRSEAGYAGAWSVGACAGAKGVYVGTGLREAGKVDSACGGVVGRLELA